MSKKYFVIKLLINVLYKFYFCTFFIKKYIFFTNQKSNLDLFLLTKENIIKLFKIKLDYLYDNLLQFFNNLFK